MRPEQSPSKNFPSFIQEKNGTFLNQGKYRFFNLQSSRRQPSAMTIMMTGTIFIFTVILVMMSAVTVMFLVQQLMTACLCLLLHQFIIGMIQNKVKAFHRQRKLPQTRQNIGFRTEQTADFFLFLSSDWSIRLSQTSSAFSYCLVCK